MMRKAYHCDFFRFSGCCLTFYSPNSECLARTQFDEYTSRLRFRFRLKFRDVKLKMCFPFSTESSCQIRTPLIDAMRAFSRRTSFVSKVHLGLRKVGQESALFPSMNSKEISKVSFFPQEIYGKAIKI